MSGTYLSHIRLAREYHQAGRNPESIELLKKVVSMRPDVYEAWATLGDLQHTESMLADAEASLQQAVALRPGSSKSRVALGLLLADRNDMEAAVGEFDHALELEPDNPKTWAQKASLLEKSGKLAGNKESAAVCYRRALELRPDYGAAHYALALLQRDSHETDDIRRMERAYQSAGLSGDDRILIGFALGRVFDDRGEYDRAFQFARQANQSQRQLFSYSTDRQAEFFQRHRKGLGREFIDHCDGQGIADNTPVFVLGMPRSGTSLVEQILASHPEVYGAGEVEYSRVFVEETEKLTDQPFPLDATRLTPEKLRELGATYIERLKSQAGDTQRVTDKLPHNFLRIGLFTAIMPAARIIVCERDPMDNCLSIYQHHFSAAHGYSCDLTELAEYYRLYRDIMTFWHELLPGRIYALSYEALVTDTETQVKQLLEYCELPFHEDCLSFHKTERSVGTPSASQIRKPVHSRSIGRWKNFAHHLEPLRSALRA